MNSTVTDPRLVCKSLQNHNRKVERFGQRVRRKRRELGLTQEQLGELSGQGRAYINRVETGNIKTPKLANAERIAESLGVSVQELYGGPLGSTGWLIEEAPGAYITDVESDELVQLYDRLPDDDRERLVVIARALYQHSRRD